MSFAFEQLPLAVQLRDDATFGNFYQADNGLLIAQLRDQLTKGERYNFVYGAQGAGCSHLLQAACHEAGKLGLESLYLPLAELHEYRAEELFEGLERLSLVCIDDIQIVIGDDYWESHLFHLFNRLKENDVMLLVSSKCAVRELPIKLADLASRLSWGGVFQIRPLSDEQRHEVLKFRAAERGMELSDEVAQYICYRCQRDTGSLLAVLDKLDLTSLKEQRRLTIPFVKATMLW
ncbi:MAG: DnaA family protein [Oceanicoccus sp.]|jgi:DnaA family protein